MDIETMAPIDELDAHDATEDEELVGDAAPRGPSNNPTAC